VDIPNTEVILLAFNTIRCVQNIRIRCIQLEKKKGLIAANAESSYETRTGETDSDGVSLMEDAAANIAGPLAHQTEVVNLSDDVTDDIAEAARQAARNTAVSQHHRVTARIDRGLGLMLVGVYTFADLARVVGLNEVEVEVIAESSVLIEPSELGEAKGGRGRYQFRRRGDPEWTVVSWERDGFSTYAFTFSRNGGVWVRSVVLERTVGVSFLEEEIEAVAQLLTTAFGLTAMTS
jgi:hypothetical protein